VTHHEAVAGQVRLSPAQRRIAITLLRDDGERGDAHVLDIASGAPPPLADAARRVQPSAQCRGRGRLWRCAADPGRQEMARVEWGLFPWQG